MNQDEYFMQLAFEEAILAKEKNEVPVGAVIVKDGDLISKAHNLVESNKNSTSHAEIIAINHAMNKTGYKHLLGCDLYVTLEPCSMCAGSIVLARLNRLIIGASDIKTGACGSVFNITDSKILNHNVDVTFGIKKKECSELLKDFFKSLRH